MLADYSRETGIAQAAKDTFSGEKPCHLCCKLAAVKKAEAQQGKQDAPMAPERAVKLLQDMLPCTAAVLAAPLSADAPPVVFLACRAGCAQHAASPPVPPPRRVV